MSQSLRGQQEVAVRSFDERIDDDQTMPDPRYPACYAEVHPPEGTMKVSAPTSKSVVSIADGVQIGRVEDVVFDTAGPVAANTNRAWAVRQ